MCISCDVIAVGQDSCLLSEATTVYAREHGRVRVAGDGSLIGDGTREARVQRTARQWTHHDR